MSNVNGQQSTVYGLLPDGNFYFINQYFMSNVNGQQSTVYGLLPDGNFYFLINISCVKSTVNF